MERKIGEIFEYDGEWYQCIVGGSCENCAFDKRKCYTFAIDNDPIGECCGDRRKDGKYVLFKKLEKVGEPFYSKFFGKFYQMYKTYIPAVGSNFKIRVTPVEYVGRNEIFIEIKQTKEDMEEKKLNLKPFDIQKAREGKPVCTRDGRKARILCYDLKGAEYPIVAAVEKRDSFAESVFSYDKNGRFDHNTENNNDLIMLLEKKEG